MIHKIEIWFDFQFKVWVTQCKDQNNNQIGEVEYNHLKREALREAKDMQKKHNCILKVFKKDGELME